MGWQIVVGHYKDGVNTEAVHGKMTTYGSHLYVAGHTHAQGYHCPPPAEGETPRCAHGVQVPVPVLLTGAGGGIGLEGQYFDNYGSLRETNYIEHPEEIALKKKVEVVI